MEGKTVVVTGASAGVGAAAARQLAGLGATVVPVGRSPEKTAAVARDLGVEPLVADFARLGDVRRLAEEIRERCPRIDVLANNAGGIFPRRVVTEDGHELTFQVNHLAPFLLTALLRDRLAATPGARVVTTSSVGNNAGRVDLDDLDWERRRWSGLRAYTTSKLLNVLFTRELARRLEGTRVTATCFHPGNIRSDFGREGLLYGIVYRTPLKHLVLISPEMGGANLTALAVRPDHADFNGARTVGAVGGDGRGDGAVIDHVTLRVGDRAASERFYDTVLPRLGHERTATAADFTEWDDFSIAAADPEHPITRRLHIGFCAPSREHADAFWHAGVDAGYADDGRPGPRPQYGSDYYGAFLLDPDGNSAEAVHHGGLRESGNVDHLWIRVADVAAARAFYAAIAPATGLRHGTDEPGRAQFRGATGSFSLVAAAPAARTEHVHLAFRAAGPAEVEAFHRAALGAGARDNGDPGERPEYHPGYFAAYAIDPDGHNVEAVHHGRR
jgi:NAD(P)-dependent dehydrogenase (short-subunit alcohol dehydrogenase family)/catechol 2,3-dioxygenase-like lactoylglutathione lyase family enzyme